MPLGSGSTTIQSCPHDLTVRKFRHFVLVTSSRSGGEEREGGGGEYEGRGTLILNKHSLLLIVLAATTGRLKASLLGPPPTLLCCLFVSRGGNRHYCSGIMVRNFLGKSLSFCMYRVSPFLNSHSPITEMRPPCRRVCTGRVDPYAPVCFWLPRPPHSLYALACIQPHYCALTLNPKP